MDSELFVEELRPFLLQTTEHFVHELLSFAKAPFDMNAYGECVVYPRPQESNHEERTGKFTITFVQTLDNIFVYYAPSMQAYLPEFSKIARVPRSRVVRKTESKYFSTLTR